MSLQALHLSLHWACRWDRPSGLNQLRKGHRQMKNRTKIEFSTVLVLGREDWDGETVVTRVDNTNYRHNRTFTLQPGEVDTGAFFLNERVDKAGEINLEHWRPLTESEEEILQGQINEARGEAERENYEYQEARRLAWGEE